jgi:hypothetical protein
MNWQHATKLGRIVEFRENGIDGGIYQNSSCDASIMWSWQGNRNEPI